MVNISLICPTRDNLKYLKWSYESVRKNNSPEIEYCVAVDFCSDGTEEWCESINKIDSYFKYIVNDGTWFGENKGESSRMGHTLLYDKLINEVCSNDVFVIWHSDMYAPPGCFDHASRLVSDTNLVSLTRIEPPLHPPGPEKIVAGFGSEPEDFNEEALINFVTDLRNTNKDKITHGIFAPWMCTKKTFQAIGGHDPLYAPQSKEDSDIFNRFLLHGCTFDQTWKGYCYHMTCRGSRYNPTLTKVGTESPEWLKQNERSTRNFIRKWGHFVKHDQYMLPIVLHKYDIGFVIKNCTEQILTVLEPWASIIYSDCDKKAVDNIITTFQPETSFNLFDRLKDIGDKTISDIIISFDGSKLTNDNAQFLFQLPEILTDSGEIGNMEYGIFSINIRSLQTYEHTLIKL